MPLNNRHGIFYVEQLRRSGLQPMSCKHILRSSCRHLGKYWSTAGQVNAGRARQKEDVITVQKYSEHLRSANNSNAVIRFSQHCQGLLQSSAGRISEKCVIVLWITCY